MGRRLDEKNMALEIIRRIIMDNALRFYTRGRLTKTINWRKIRRIAKRYADAYGLNLLSILTYCGKFLKLYSQPSRKGSPHNYYVNTLLLQKLFGLSLEKTKHKELNDMTPIELYYTVLFIEEQNKNTRQSGDS